LRFLGVLDGEPAEECSPVACFGVDAGIAIFVPPFTLEEVPGESVEFKDFLRAGTAGLVGTINVALKA
jgi:hypothetical protein